MTSHRSIALIPAAGMGKRMGASINKQYLDLDGTPILARTVAIFETSPLIDSIYLVIPEEEIPFCQQNVVDAFGFKKVTAIISGGRERQNSVMNGLSAMRSAVADTDVILVHDGVRPLFNPTLLSQTIEAAIRHDGAVVAVPVKDTIKSASGDFIIGTPPRETLWQAQTPQAFRFGILYHAYIAAEINGFCGTDDASIVEQGGGRIMLVRGDYNNIKVTTPEDLILAKALFNAVERGSL